MEKKYNKDGKESKRTWYPRWCKYKELLPSLTVGVEDGLSYDEFTKKCLDELDQLLSERTFDREELRILSTSTEWVDYIALQEECKDITDLEEKHKKVCKKIFKLLKEGE